MKNKIVKIIGILLIIYTLKSCTSVKSYEKNYLNDSEMQLSTRKIEKTENNFFLYREGSSGANGGRNGGGCGCN